MGKSIAIIVSTIALIAACAVAAASAISFFGLDLGRFAPLSLYKAEPKDATDLSFFGFELGKPVGLNECRHKILSLSKIKSYEDYQTSTCVKRYLDSKPGEARSVGVFFSASESPYFVKGSSAHLIEKDGIVIGIGFNTEGKEDDVFAKLKEKYGNPTVVSKKVVVKELAGVSYTEISAKWEFKNLRIAFIAEGAPRNSGLVTVDLPESAKLRDEYAASRKSDHREM